VNAADFLQVQHRSNGSAWSLDVRMLGARYAYGAPEHALDLVLPATFTSSSSNNNPEGKDEQLTEPYRMYNLDVFEYEIGNPIGLYGAVPMVIGLGPGAAYAVLVMNAGQLFVDVAYSNSNGNAKESYVDVRFSAEERPIDVYLMSAPTIQGLLQQYAYLTGTHPQPQYFALGYHQCRWNYKDEPDVYAVHDGFDRHGIPLDVVWLDIEHTLGKRYFTWDPVLFPTPVAMQQTLAARGRKMVTITDPHIKRADDYHVHTTATAKGYYVKKDIATNTEEDFEGFCWPGHSSYLDFLNPAVRAYYASLFGFDSYAGATPSLYHWIDMNEPSVFDGPEVTMPKTAAHRLADGTLVPHGRVHNVYGYFHAMATYAGMVQRSASLERTKDGDRPFVLTRSFFAGSQRYAAVWTGDNSATWEHLRASVPMLLTLGLSGIPFVGADVGGFFGNPDAELFVRWNEIGAWQPFYRGHAHLETKRREPWVYGDAVADKMRHIVALRYSFLPLWYTLFFEHAHSGAPVMRPLFWSLGSAVSNNNDNDHVWKEQRAFMLGDALLVVPVMQAGATSVRYALPSGHGMVWYHFPTMMRYADADSSVEREWDAPLGRGAPLFVRGGYIVPRKETVRRATAAMHPDPYTLWVALSAEGAAEGRLYVDDGHSFAYETQKAYSLRKFRFAQNVLHNEAGDLLGVAAPWSELAGKDKLEPRYDDGTVVNKVVVMGLMPSVGRRVKEAFLQLGGETKNDVGDVDVTGVVMRERKTVVWDEGTNTLTIEDVRAPTVGDWSLSLGM
jgi:alpha 1,3-glucosidase